MNVKIASGNLTPTQLMAIGIAPIPVVANQTGYVPLFIAGNLQFTAGSIPYQVTTGTTPFFSIGGDPTFADGPILAQVEAINIQTILQGPTSSYQCQPTPEYQVGFDYTGKNLYLGVQNTPFTISAGNGILSYQIFYIMVPT